MFKGIMLSGVPNLAFLIGHTNASWTLKVGLVCEHFMRLLSHMHAAGYDKLVPTPDAEALSSTGPLRDGPVVDPALEFSRRRSGTNPDSARLHKEQPRHEFEETVKT
ncbi:MAG TPA: hypothetical protein VHV75_04885 [Solirubrobacteraceae bacterium]|nr:hypothetical protein [Solirubrobacteraceae bacterium]